MGCLQKIGEGSFMMKTCGLTVLRKTALGRFYIDGGVLIDSLSGVRFMMKNLKLVMFRCPVLGCVRVAWTTLESQVLAYLSFEKLLWDESEAQELQGMLSCASQSYDQNCVNGCRKWLDDWSEEEPKRRKSYDRLGLISAISACQKFTVTLKNRGLEFTSSFYPKLVDVDGEVLRISEKKGRAVIFADMSQTRFSFVGETGSITA